MVGPIQGSTNGIRIHCHWPKKFPMFLPACGMPPGRFCVRVHPDHFNSNGPGPVFGPQVRLPEKPPEKEPCGVGGFQRGREWMVELGAELNYLAVVVKTVLGSQFGVGEFTTHFGTYFCGGLGCSLGVRDFDPWPFRCLGIRNVNIRRTRCFCVPQMWAEKRPPFGLGSQPP